MVNLGGGLLTAFPDERVLRPALEHLEVLATVEIIANETTALSTHVLPTKDQLERADINLWDFLSPRVAGLYSPAVVEPVGDRRSSWWVLSELGRRLGYDLAAELPPDDQPASDDVLLAAQAVRARCTFEDLVDNGYIETAHELPAQWIEDYLEELGGWRLAPAQLVAQLAALGTPSTLCLVPRRQKRHVNSQFTFLGDGPEVLLHPDDAASAGGRRWTPVIVRTASGELVGTARVDTGMRRGAVSVPHGHEDANVKPADGPHSGGPADGYGALLGRAGEPASPHRSAAGGRAVDMMSLVCAIEGRPSYRRRSGRRSRSPARRGHWRGTRRRWRRPRAAPPARAAACT